MSLDRCFYNIPAVVFEFSNFCWFNSKEKKKEIYQRLPLVTSLAENSVHYYIF